MSSNKPIKQPPPPKPSQPVKKSEPVPPPPKTAPTNSQTSRPTSSPVRRRTLAATVGAGAAATLIAFVPKFEGMVLRGYADPIGIVTACAGHTKTAVLGRPYSIEECNTLLDEDLLVHAEGVANCVDIAPLTPNQRAAFVSFAYNVGVSAFCGSTMARKIRAGDIMGACGELTKWVYAGGKKLNGLVRRREAERDLCTGTVRA